MADDRLIRELLEEMLETGAPPEQACAEHRRLLPEVRRRWQLLRATRAQVDAVFPSTSGGPVTAHQTLTAAPQLPGYENVAFIGRGGMGVVYRARHTALRRTVAVKMLLPGHYADETECLLREASAVAALQHPNIVQVFDVGVHEGRPYFTMEYLGGGSLAQQNDGSPRPPREAAALVATLADAVQSAHEAGIVHRDLKPGNILFSDDGVAKITDFSLARQIVSDPGDTLGPPGAGTPSYMAPEQAAGGSLRCGPAVDVYALGAVLYDLLTGRAPFRADSPAETLRQVMSQEPAPPSRINSRVPRDLETVCLACLQKDPAGRYASARALADDLRRYQSGLPIEARRAGVLRRAAKWARRRPAHAALVALVLGAVVAGTAWSFWAASRRAATVTAVQADLAQIHSLSSAGRLAEARGLIALAAGRLGDDGPAPLRDALVAAGRAVDLAGDLEALRMQRTASAEVRFDRERYGERYEQTLRNAGIILGDGDTPQQIAERIVGSPVRWSIVAGLNDWALCSRTMEQARRRLDIARYADPHPGWRDKVRDVTNWSKPGTVRQLASDAPVDPRSAALSPILSSLLQEYGDDPTEYLRRVQAANPSDFWANFQLAERLDAVAPAEAVGFYRAARSLRPDSVAAAVNLGIALNVQGLRDEAKECWTAAVALNPRNHAAHLNLALVALNERRAVDAQRSAELAIQTNPESVQAPLMLAEARALQGDWRDALSNVDKADSMMTAGDEFKRLATESRRRFTRALELIETYEKDPRFQANVNGSDVADLVDALLCRGQARKALALCENASAADLTPAEAAEWAFDCARAAAQVSAAPGQAAAERRRRREQSLSWLQQFVSLAAARTGSETSVRDNRLAVQPLRYDPLLEPVRSNAALGAMESDEATRWREFWARVQGIAAGTPAR